MHLSKKKRAAKLSITAMTAIFLSVSLLAFNYDLGAALAQIQGQNSNNFGTFGTYNYTNEVNSGTKGIWNNLTGRNSGGYNSYIPNAAAYNQDPFNTKFGTRTTYQQYQQQAGFTGFLKGIFSGGSNSTAAYNTYNTYNPANTTGTYSNYNAYNAYNNMYNANTITAIQSNKFGNPQPGSANYNNYYNTNANNYYNTTTGNNYYNTTTGNNYYNTQMGQTAQKLGGGALARFFGGIVDGVTFVGGKVVYAGEKAITGLNNVNGKIAMGMAASTTGLVGAIGKALGFGARVVIGAAKVAITIPVLATKAGIYLTTVSCVGTVRLLGSGLNALKNITGNSTSGLNQLNYNVSNLSNQTLAFGTNPQNTNYYTNNSNFPTNFNNQQFGNQLNNTLLYTNQLQQNMTTSQGVVNTIQLGAQKTMTNFKINTKIAGITLLELGTKLVYKTASLLSGSASSVSLALGQSIQNMEYTKANLRLIKEMNKQGIVNPYLYQQYLTQSQQSINQSRNLFGTANQNINNSYLSTLSNINQTRNYINTNNPAITNQMNQYGNSLYTQNLPYNTLNQYNNNFSNLNNTYTQVNGTFGNPQPANMQTTSTVNSTISNLFNFNEGASAERKPNEGAAASVETRDQSPEVRKAYENYMAAYNKYIDLLAKDSEDGKAADVSSALEDYKKAYSEYETLSNKAAGISK
jgi:hypothetical protein